MLPQAFLGIAFSFGIPMAYAAVHDAVPPIAWWLLVLNLFWVVAYDTEYAMVDRDDDLRLGLNTSAIFFGRHDVLAVMFCYAVYLAGMVAAGMRLGLGFLYYAGLGVALALRGVSLDAHQAARAHGMLPGVPAQPLARLRGVRRHRARCRRASFRVAAHAVTMARERAAAPRAPGERARSPRSSDCRRCSAATRAC